MTTELTAADQRYLGLETTLLVQNIMREGYGAAKTVRGCRGAIRRGLRRTYGKATTVFERQGWYSTSIVIGSEEADYEWAIRVSGYITNPNFYAEPETGSTIAVYGI